GTVRAADQTEACTCPPVLHAGRAPEVARLARDISQSVPMGWLAPSQSPAVSMIPATADFASVRSLMPMLGCCHGRSASCTGALDALADPLLTTSVAARRGYGEDSIYWHAAKGRYVGAVSLGYDPKGKRVRKSVTGKTKAEVRDKLKELHRQLEEGTASSPTY